MRASIWGFPTVIVGGRISVISEKVMLVWCTRAGGGDPTVRSTHACDRPSCNATTRSTTALGRPWRGRSWQGAEGKGQRQRRRSRYRQRRERREQFGALVQMDGSFHHWCGLDHQQSCLIEMIG